MAIQETVRRRAVALAAVAVAACALAPALLAVPGRAPEPPPAPPRTTGPGFPPDQAEVAGRLGGLAGLVAGTAADDPLLASCAAPAAPVPDVDPAGAGGVAAVIARTEAVRGLALAQSPEIELVDAGTMADRMGESLRRAWGEQRLDLEQRYLTALGAIDPGADLARQRVDAVAGQISGYANIETGEVAVRVAGDRLSPLERVVLAHELEHVLSGANLGRPADHHDGDISADRARAFNAVVEGSATLTMVQYATGALDPDEQAGLRQELADRAAAGALAGLSPYLRWELQFPYVAGLRYLCHRWRDGGWDAVAAAYRNPPPSTAAVLFPDRAAAAPRPPGPLGDPGDGWERARSRAFGAAELEWLLAAPGGEPDAAPADPRGRAGAWAGGELTLWVRGTDSAVGVSLVDRGTGPPLCGTVRQWYAAAFPDADPERAAGRTVFRGRAQDAALACAGDRVRLGIAPGAAEALAVTGA